MLIVLLESFYCDKINVVIFMDMRDFANRETYTYRDELISVWDYTKVLLLTVIPGFGLIFSFLLAFSRNNTGKLKNLARATLIVRFVLWAFLIVGISVWLNEIWPFLQSEFSKYSKLLPMLLFR